MAIFQEDNKIKTFSDISTTNGAYNMILQEIGAKFDTGQTKIFSAELIKKLNRNISKKALSQELATYGIKPKMLRIGNKTGRGYTVGQFARLTKTETTQKTAYRVELKTGERMTCLSFLSAEDLHQELNKTIYINRIRSITQ